MFETPHCLPLDIAERLVGQVRELATIKVVLTVARLARLHGTLAVPEAVVLADPALRRGIRPAGTERDPSADIAQALDVAVARGFLVRLRSRTPETSGTWVALATPEALALAQRDPARLLPLDRHIAPAVSVERPNVFSLYEQNIGPLTPLIAEKLAEALETYPTSWVEDAIVEAVHYGRRNWRYVQRILERWAIEGRHHEAHSRDRRDRTLDPDKYLRGKYAPLFSNPD